jgi:hypothetical protein
MASFHSMLVLSSQVVILFNNNENLYRQCQGIGNSMAIYIERFEFRAHAQRIPELSKGSKFVSGSNAQNACLGIQADLRPSINHFPAAVFRQFKA